MKLPVPAIISDDLPRKLVAFFFGLLIWFAVEQQLHDREIFDGVPVYLDYNKSELVVEREVIPVRVIMSGARQSLDRTETSDLEASAKVPVVPEGIYSYDLHLSPDNIKAPPGMRVREISPERVMLKVDRLVTAKNVPIRIRYAGSLRDGLKISRAAVFPPVADVTGPSKIVSNIRQLVTEPVILDENITRPFEVDVGLMGIPSVTTSVDTVHVTIEITSQSGQQAYADLPIHVMAPADVPLQVARLLPTVSVTLHGSQVALDALTQESVRPFVDVSTVTEPGRYRRAVQVWIDGAPSVTAEYVHPSMVEVVLEPVGMPGRAAPSMPVPGPREDSPVAPQ